MAAPPPLEAYAALPAMEQLTLSPSGERYAFIAKDGDARRLFVAGADNKPIDAVDVGDAKIVDVTWAGDDYVLVSTLATLNLGLDFTVSKHELEAVVVVNLKTHANFAVFQQQKATVAGAVFGRFGARQVDGRWYGYFGGVTYERDKGGSYLSHTWPDLYRVDLETGDAHLLTRGQESLVSWAVDAAGQVEARTLYDAMSGAWRVTALTPGGRDLAKGVSPLVRPHIGLGRKPDQILIGKPNEDGGYDYVEAPLAGGEATPLGDQDKFWGPASDPNTGVLVGEFDHGDDMPTVFFDPTAQMKWRAASRAFPGYRTRIESWSSDFNRLVVFTDGKDDSGTYWLVDIAKRSASQLGRAYPGVKPADVGPVRMIDYQAGDGLALHGVLTLPPGREPKNLPLVVLPHGGPEDRDFPGFDWLAQAFAARGYAVFQPNFRGSSGYGQDFVRAGYGQWGRKMQTDVSDGVAELTRQGIADPHRACIVGWSYGGYAALAGVTVQQGLYRCAVSVAGVADLPSMLTYERDMTGGVGAKERYWKTFMGATSGSEAELKPLSPARRADRADAPILLIHGKEDTTVPVDQSQTMEKALRSAGKPVETVYLPGGDHQLSQAQTRLAMLQAAVAFVEKYDPAEAAVTASKGAP
ncbi:MAG: S9 family peptidase [Proteobacteria bacterium]|nr:S9 family peptidase [Pseudomonadota bacterium]